MTTARKKKRTNSVKHHLLGKKNFFPQWLRSFATRFLSIILWPIKSKLGRAVMVILFVLVVLGFISLLRELPSPTNLTQSENFAVSTQIFDRNGQLLYEIFADENRQPITLDQVPDHVIQATIAIEDQRFYSHFGVDIIGTTRALLNNLQGKPIEGGSTLTQQLVKNALLTNERSLQRKAKEAVLAVMTEFFYSKDQIMEMYLNYVSYGGTAVGIESAANYYFDKSVSDLSLAEASLLAGLPQAPSVYSPFGSNPQRARDRQKEVLRRMVEEDFITPAQAESAQTENIQFALQKTDIKAPHFVFYVRDLLYEQYGVETVQKGGLRVTTTLDLELHEAAQASVSAEIADLERFRVGNGAALVVKPNTGEILSMVGSKDYFNSEDDGEVNVTLALRQPGSSIKPIMYTIGFQEKLINPGTIFLDVPTCFEVPGQKDYCPRNYDGSFKGPVTVRRALANSLNIPAVKGLRLLGLETFIDWATRLGITTWEDPSNYGLSLTLGGGEVRMIEMAQAFGVIANQGVKMPLTPILKVETFRGEILEEIDPATRKEDLAILTEFDGEEAEGVATRVLDRAPAYLTAHIMQDNRARSEAFGSRSELVIPDQIVSAKTGTTNDLKDNWTVGFTSEYLVITWVGNNDSSPMNPFVVSGVTGAAPIFNDIMSYILAGQESSIPAKPGDITSAAVCASGFPPGSKQDQCPITGEPELFWERSEPSASQLVTEQVWIRPETGLPPAPGESTDGLVLEEKTFYADPVSPRFCQDCVRATNEEGQTVYERQSIPASGPSE